MFEQSEFTKLPARVDFCKRKAELFFVLFLLPEKNKNPAAAGGGFKVNLRLVNFFNLYVKFKRFTGQRMVEIQHHFFVSNFFYNGAEGVARVAGAHHIAHF